jgi:hypothetical protein
MKLLVLCLSLTALSLLLIATPINAQEATVTGPGKFTIPPVQLPALAKEMNRGGRISVRVEINEKGEVISVGPPGGPVGVCPGVNLPEIVALRNAAAEAAKQARFDPASVGSVPQPIFLYFDFPTNKPQVIIGQQEQVSADRISGGVLNGKATSLPKPPYPAAARAVLASGLVRVEVLIIEDGTVFSAVATEGHPLLRSPARNAACEARFEPTFLDGKPVKIAGFISYNFVLP